MNDPQKLNTISLQITDYYLREINLGTWTFMNSSGDIDKTLPQRDATLGHPQAKALYDEKFQLMEVVYQVIVTLQPQFANVTLGQRITRLSTYYQQQTRQNQQFYTLDESDDSDLEDEKSLSSYQTSPKKRRLLQREQLLANPDLWTSTKRTTTQSKGLTDKLPAVIANQENIIDNLKKIQAMLTQNHQKRAALPEFNATDGRPEFVALYRGNNYMSDRWTTPARREHYYADETFKPQFSEAALKAGLDADFYTQLSEDTNPYRNPKLMHKITNLAEDIRQAYAKLHENTYQIQTTVSPSKITPYMFNHHADWMQHEFSNGINRHLETIKDRLTKPYWKQYFVNAFNYALATGNRPYHSLKYAIGAKEYYPYSFPLRYNADGSLPNCHAGKIYIILIPKETFLRQSHINRVVPKNYSGQLPIGLRILPELETSFIGAIPAEQVIYQEPLKFPSFNKRWQDVARVYAIKYGFDETLYKQFQSLITTTFINTPERTAVLNLLKEWLCAFHEVMLLKTAEREATNRGGRLVYVDHEDASVNLPDKNPKTNGGANSDQRNRVALLERLRGLIGTELEAQPPPANMIAFVKAKIDDNSFLDLLRYTTAVTTNEDARRLLEGWEATFNPQPIEHPITKMIVNPNAISLPSIPYSNQHITRLLQYYTQRLANCRIEPAALPWVISEFHEAQQAEFIQSINRIVLSVIDNTSHRYIVPINTSTTEFEHWHFNLATWIGIVISFDTGRLQLQLHDPRSSQQSFLGALEDYDEANEPSIITLLKTISIPAGIQNRFLCYQKEQEPGVHSGPWLVDSLALIARGARARNLSSIQTQMLRNAHLAKWEALPG